jgi:hypothetical protein
MYMYMYLGCQIDIVRGFPLKVVSTELVPRIREAVHYVVSPRDQHIPTAG